MNQITYYTEESLKKLKEDLHKLKTVDRKNVIRDVAEAREKGDLSENAEYDAAKDAQALLEKRIKELEVIVGNARVIAEKDIDVSKVGTLSKVTVLNKKLNKTFVYNIVPTVEADLKQGKISMESPISQGLLGKAVGDSAVINIPAGKLEFEILNIEI